MHPLKIYLNHADIDRSDFAKTLGITPQYLYLILSGKRWPSFKLAKKIETVTGISWVELMQVGRI